MDNIYKKINSDMTVIQAVTTGEISNTLDPAVYTVKFNDSVGFYLSRVADTIKLPSKVYQSKRSKEVIEDIITAYEDSVTSMGVILVGNKGGSKTTTANILGSELMKKDLSIIMVEEPFIGPSFYSFVDSIGECVLLFDEFTKVYWEHNKVESLLPMFDGRNNIKRLTIVIDNKLNRFSSYMLGRPGRFRYLLKYGTLEPSVIDMYIKDNLKLKRKVKLVTSLLHSITMLNFDTMEAIVKDVNLFPKRTLPEIVGRLNIDFEEYSEEIDVKTVKVLNDRVKRVHKIVVKENDIRVTVTLDNDESFTTYLLEIRVKDGIVSGCINDRVSHHNRDRAMTNATKLSFPFELSPTMVYTWVNNNDESDYY